jgi:branched-chain amino acid transport system ATP-binding protein
MLELAGVSTAYGGVPMLESVDMEVARGELVCVLGPNGAGKTTTFRAITGLVRPTAGTVRLNGTDTRGMRVDRIARMGLGVVPEGRRVFPGLTVRENLRLGYAVTAQSYPFDERLAYVTELFPRLGDRLQQQAGTLSGGEQSMLALGRALVSAPGCLVMDEPSLGLSPKLVDEYFDLIESIRGHDQAILLIEQNVERSLAIADRAYVLSRGRIVDAGTAGEIVSRGSAADVYLGRD